MISHIVTIIAAVIAIILVILVITQESKSSGLGTTITGLSNSYLFKTKSRTKESRKVRGTMIGIIVLLLLCIASNLVFFAK